MREHQRGGSLQLHGAALVRAEQQGAIAIPLLVGGNGDFLHRLSWLLMKDAGQGAVWHQRSQLL